MKQTMSIHEFCDYLSTHRPSRISYWTENQTWFKVADPCKLRMTFTIMLIRENPNVITLHCADGNEMFFDHVKYIEMDDNFTVLGTLLTVFCGNCKSTGKDVAYTVILS